MEGTAKNKIIITGATGSMGIVATREMVREGYPVIMACRNLKKGEEVRQSILQEQPNAQLDLRQLDLASQASIRSFVEGLAETPICGIFNNAGIMNRRYHQNEDGFEHTMAVNFLGNALLTRLLVPLFTPGAHIVNMVSLTTKFAHLDSNWQQWGEKKFSQLGTYGSSKLALLYFTIGFAKRYPQFIVNMADPGIVDSAMISMDRWFDPLANIFFRPFIKTPEQGVAPALAALHTKENLRYFVGKKQKPVPTRFLENSLVDTLWEQASALLRL